MDIGYARVSTQDQHPALQLDALHTVGCAKVFVEQASGPQRERPQLHAALDYARPGDTLINDIRPRSAVFSGIRWRCANRPATRRRR